MSGSTKPSKARLWLGITCLAFGSLSALLGTLVRILLETSQGGTDDGVLGQLVGGGLCVFGVMLIAVSIDESIVATRPNTCRSCGYDLTGNTTGKCPECGAAASGIMEL